jgi:hypothetical protein
MLLLLLILLLKLVLRNYLTLRILLVTHMLLNVRLSWYYSILRRIRLTFEIILLALLNL